MSTRRSDAVDAELVLRKLRVPEDVRRHSREVKEIALAVARRISARGRKVDFGLVRAGALLHDVGRGATHGPAHCAEGARMLRKAGVDEKVARFAEVHFLAGLTAAEARGLGLPAKGFAPSSVEEKAVCYADKICDGRKLARIRAYLGEKSTAYKRILSLMREVEGMTGGEIVKVQDFDAMVAVERGGKYLVLRRKSPKIWEFPGGAIEWGEPPQEAARRECEEECGLKVAVGKVLGTTSAVFEKGGKLKHAVYIVFWGKVVDGKLRLSREHTSARWVGKKELAKLDLGFNARPVVEFLKK